MDLTAYPFLQDLKLSRYLYIYSVRINPSTGKINERGDPLVARWVKLLPRGDVDLENQNNLLVGIDLVNRWIDSYLIYDVSQYATKGLIGLYLNSKEVEVITDSIRDNEKTLSQEDLNKIGKIDRVYNWLLVNKLVDERRDDQFTYLDLLMIAYSISVSKVVSPEISRKILDDINLARDRRYITEFRSDYPDSLQSYYGIWLTNLLKEQDNDFSFGEMIKYSIDRLGKISTVIARNLPTGLKLVDDGLTETGVPNWAISVLNIDRTIIYGFPEFRNQGGQVKYPTDLNGIDLFNQSMVSRVVPAIQLKVYDQITGKQSLVYHKIYEGETPRMSPILDRIMPESQARQKGTNLTLVMLTEDTGEFDLTGDQTKVTKASIKARNPATTNKQSYTNIRYTLHPENYDNFTEISQFEMRLPIKGEGAGASSQQTVQRALDIFSDTLDLDIRNYSDGGIGGHFFLIGFEYHIESLAYMILIDPTLRSFLYIDEVSKPLFLKDRVDLHIRNFFPGDENKPTGVGYIRNLAEITVILTQMTVDDKRGKVFQINQTDNNTGQTYTREVVYPFGTKYIEVNVTRVPSNQMMKRLALLLYSVFVYYTKNNSYPFSEPYGPGKQIVGQQYNPFDSPLNLMHLERPPYNSKIFFNRDHIQGYLNEIILETRSNLSIYRSRGEQELTPVRSARARGTARALEADPMNASGLSRICLKPHKPSNLGRDEQAKEALVNKLVFYNGKMIKRTAIRWPNPAVYPDSWAWYVCPGDEFPFVYHKPVGKEGLTVHTHIPCCGKVPDSKSIRQKEENYLKGLSRKTEDEDEADGRPAKQSNYAKLNAIALKPGEFGRLRPEINLFISGQPSDPLHGITSGEESEEKIMETLLRRLGMINSPNSLIHCIISVLEPNYLSLNDREKEMLAREYRLRFLAEIHPEIIRQEAPTLQTVEIKEILETVDSYFDPLMFYRLVEEFFQIHIFFFNVKSGRQREDEMDGSVLALPYFQQFPIVTNKTNINDGKERKTFLIGLTPPLTPKYPYQCELIVTQYSGNNQIERNSFDGNLGNDLIQTIYQLYPIDSWSWDLPNSPTANDLTLVSNSCLFPQFSLWQYLLNRPNLSGRIQFIGQYFDQYGKMRGLAFYFNGVHYTINSFPGEPANLPTANQIFRPTLQQVRELMSQNPIGSYSLIEQISDQQVIVDGIWYPIYDNSRDPLRQSYQNGLYFPITPTVIQVDTTTRFTPGLHLTTETDQSDLLEDPLYRYHQLNRTNQVILKVIEWLLSILNFQREKDRANGKALQYDSLSEHFIKEYIWPPSSNIFVGDSIAVYRLDDLSRVLPIVNTIDEALLHLSEVFPSLVPPVDQFEIVESFGRLSIDSSEQISQRPKSLGQVPRVYLYNLRYREGIIHFIRMVQVYSYSLIIPRAIDELFIDETDFHQDPHTIILLNSNDFKLWKERQPVNLNSEVITGRSAVCPMIHNNLFPRQSTTQQPFILNNLFRSGLTRRYLVQNTVDRSLGKALMVAEYWYRKQINLGPNPPTLYEPYPYFVLYDLDSDGHLLIDHNYTPLDNTNYLEIVRYNYSDKDSDHVYAALLPIGDLNYLDKD